MKRTNVLAAIAFCVAAAGGAALVFGGSSTAPAETPATPTPQADETGPAATAGEGWSDGDGPVEVSAPATTSLLRHAPRYNGAYSTLRPSQPSLAATADWEQAARTLGVDPGNHEQTETWVRTLLADGLRTDSFLAVRSNETHLRLSDYYDATRVLTAGNGTAPASLATAIDGFERADGGYCSLRVRDGDCVTGPSVPSTVRATVALHTLGAGDSVEPATVAWLRNQSTNTSVADRVTVASGIDRLRALQNVYYRALLADRTDVTTTLDRASLASSRGSVTPLVANRTLSYTATLYYARSLRLTNVSVPEPVADRIHQNRAVDGGYNFLGRATYADARGTAMAVGGLPAGARPGGDGAVGSLLQYYRLDTGGFAPAPRPSPSLQKTLFVVESREILGLERTVDRSAVVDGEVDSLESAYAVCLLAPSEACDGTDDRTARQARAAFERDSLSLKAAFYATTVANRTGLSMPRERLRERIADSRAGGRYGSSTRSTYYAVGTLANLGVEPANESVLVDRIRESRADGAGYRLQRGNRTADSADVTGTFMSLRMLRWLDRAPRNPETLVTWLGRLESPNGGFTYRVDGRADPSFQGTYYVLRALRLAETQL